MPLPLSPEHIRIIAIAAGTAIALVVLAIVVVCCCIRYVQKLMVHFCSFVEMNIGDCEKIGTYFRK